MNKIIVSIILAVILVVGINKITNVIYNVEKPEKSAYQVESVTTVASNTTSESEMTNLNSENIMAIFASTSVEDGAKVVLIKLDLHCGEFLEEKQVPFLITNIPKH